MTHLINYKMYAMRLNTTLYECGTNWIPEIILPFEPTPT